MNLMQQLIDDAITRATPDLGKSHRPPGAMVAKQINPATLAHRPQRIRTLGTGGHDAT
jgi:hypothetical protein